MNASLPSISTFLSEQDPAQQIPQRQHPTAHISSFSLDQISSSPDVKVSAGDPQSPSDRFLNPGSRRQSLVTQDIYARDNLRTDMSSSAPAVGIDETHLPSLTEYGNTDQHHIDYKQEQLDGMADISMQIRSDLQSPVEYMPTKAEHPEDYFSHAPLSINTDLPVPGAFHLRSGPLSDPGVSHYHSGYPSMRGYQQSPLSFHATGQAAARQHPFDRFAYNPNGYSNSLWSHSYDDRRFAASGEQPNLSPTDDASSNELPMHSPYSGDHNSPYSVNYSSPHSARPIHLPPPPNLRSHSMTGVDMPFYGDRQLVHSYEQFPSRLPPIVTPPITDSRPTLDDFLAARSQPRSPSYSDGAMIAGPSSAGLPVPNDWQQQTRLATPDDSQHAASPSSANEPLPATGSSSASQGRYICAYCQKRFTRPSSLKIHVHSHTGEKPYQCEICGKGFSVSSNLRRHGKIHLSRDEAQPIAQDETNQPAHDL